SAYGLSESFTLLKGCWQGCGWSLAKFCGFLDMCIRWIQSENLGFLFEWSPASCKKSIKIPAVAIMDDLTLIASSQSDIRKMLDMVYHFLEYYRMSLNVKKCAYMYRMPEGPNFL